MPFIWGLAMLALFTSCGVDKNEKQTGDRATNGVETGDAKTGDDGVSGDDGSTPEPLAGPPIEFTTLGGFRWSISLHEITTSPTQPTGQGTAVAAPGYLFPIFTAKLTNLQTDRPAPVSSNTFFLEFKFSVPATAVATGQGRAGMTCDKDGVAGCLSNNSEPMNCLWSDAGTPPKVMDHNTSPLAAGMSMTISCYGNSHTGIEASQLRLYVSENGWKEIRRPNR